MPQSIEIFDLENVSWWRLSGALSGLRMFSRALSVGQDHYPENLRKAFVLNAPAAIAILWTVVLFVLSARTKAKISITRGPNRDGLAEFMDEAEIDRMFGSCARFAHAEVDVRRRLRQEEERETKITAAPAVLAAPAAPTAAPTFVGGDADVVVLAI